jgi:hypothetical protein
MKNSPPKIRNVIWDYDFSEQDLCKLLEGTIDRLGHMTRTDLIIRMLNYLTWYDFIKFFPKDKLCDTINEILNVKFKDQKRRRALEFVRNFLQRKAVSASGPDF